MPAFIIEELEDGRFTVFVPSIPTPLAGAVYVLSRDRVHPLDVPFTQAIQTVSRWGSGAKSWWRRCTSTPLKTSVRAAHDGGGMPGFSFMLNFSQCGETVAGGVNGHEGGLEEFASLQAISRATVRKYAASPLDLTRDNV